MKSEIPARELYRIEVLPAGKNDRMVHIMDSEGRTLRYIYSRHSLGSAPEEKPEAAIAQDLARMGADEFARKYRLPTREEGNG